MFYDRYSTDLTGLEAELLSLFRRIPESRRAEYMIMLEDALKVQGLI